MRILWDVHHEVENRETGEWERKTVKDGDGLIVPDCCEAARRWPIVTLEYLSADLSDEPACLADAPLGLDEMSDWNSPSEKQRWLDAQPAEAKAKTRFEVATPRWTIARPSLELMVKLYQDWKEYEKHFSMPAPSHCPHCGTDLPPVEWRPVTDQIQIHHPVGDGDYCGSCSQRSRNCRCGNPVLRWQTVKTENER